MTSFERCIKKIYSDPNYGMLTFLSRPALPATCQPRYFFGDPFSPHILFFSWLPTFALHPVPLQSHNDAAGKKRSESKFVKHRFHFLRNYLLCYLKFHAINFNIDQEHLNPG
jgi:hypothetical protein